MFFCSMYYKKHGKAPVSIVQLETQLSLIYSLSHGYKGAP